MHVVAAENFWGNITSQLGGRDVEVTSLITNPNADPHLFETDAADAATLAQAQVVVENGAGYDTWMGSLLGADSGHPKIVNAASVLHVGGQRSQPPPLVRHPPRAHRGRRHHRRAEQGGTAGRVDVPRQPRPLRCVARPHRRHPGHHQGALPQRVRRLHRAGPRLRAGRGRPRRQDPARLRPGDRGRRRPRSGRHARHATAHHRPRHQRPPLQRADRDAGDDADAGPGQAARHPRRRRVRDDAGRRRHLPAVAAVAADRPPARARDRAAARDRTPGRARPRRRAHGDRARCGRSWTWRCPKASSSPCWAPTARARPRCSRCCSASSPCPGGTVRVNGAPPRRGNPELGYVPQQQAFERTLPIRGPRPRALRRRRTPLGPAAATAASPSGGSTPRSRAVGASGLRRRPGRPALGRRAATAAHRPGPAGRPQGAPVRRAPPRPRPGQPARRDAAHRRAPPRRRNAGRLRDPRGQSRSCPTSTGSCTSCADGGPSAPPPRS